MNVAASLIVVSWNTNNILRNTLKSIYDHHHKYTFEVIVIDNASTDSSTEMVESDFPEAILLKNTDNVGYSKACNQGIALAKGRYILLMNSDVTIKNDGISKILEFAERNPDASIFGSRVLKPDGTLQQSCFMFPSLLNIMLWGTCLYKLFPNSKFFGREDMTWWDANDEREVDVIKGCFLLVRQKHIPKVGLLDEDYFMFAEETDWCYRFKKAGFKIMFTPTAEITHVGGESTKQREFQMKLQLYKSKLLFIKKHKGHIQYVVGYFLVGVFLFLRIPFKFTSLLLSKYQLSYE